MPEESRKILREPEPPELPLRRYWRERDLLLAAQRRWATDIVNLDDE